MTHRKLRQAYIDFFADRGHIDIQSAPLVLQGDATTLFTSSGMQPLVPYLSGKEKHKDGTRLVDIQRCIRLGDIEEVGDWTHNTFFEMIGNWSLGDYSKKDQLTWKWEFLTNVLGLNPDKLYVTIFEGNESVPKDVESVEMWKELGVNEDHIFEYGAESNWWSRSGVPENMPVGEIGGPSSEVYYDFGEGPHDGPESDEDRFLEIGNSVFIEYEKQSDGGLSKLDQFNVDFGGGLERLLAATLDIADVYRSDLFLPIIETVEDITGKTYNESTSDMRVVADHMRAATFLIHDGVVPSNKEHGYILRRLLRRAAIRMHAMMGGVEGLTRLPETVSVVVDIFKDIYFEEGDVEAIQNVVKKEMSRFARTLERGLKKIEKVDMLDEQAAFDLFQSHGFPFELTAELALEKGITLNKAAFDKEVEKHQKLSRSASAGKFKGGLADESDQVIKYHTATHLLHQALKDVFGDIIRQEGSNITQDRLRFDTRLDRKPTEEELKDVEKIMNSKVKEALPVYKKSMAREEADTIGAASFFREKYGDTVTVYFIGGSEDDPSSAYSKEFCGGPHVENTSDIGPLHISKVKKIGANLVRIYVTS